MLRCRSKGKVGGLAKKCLTDDEEGEDDEDDEKKKKKKARN